MADRNWNLDTWTPWSQPSVPLYLTLTLNPSFEPLQKTAGRTLFTSVLLFEEGSATWIFRSDEARDLGRHLIDLLRTPSYFEKFRSELAIASAELQEFLDAPYKTRMLSGGTDSLLGYFRELESLYTAFYRLAAFIEPVQIAVEAEFKRFVAGSEGEIDTTPVFVAPEEPFTLAIQESLIRVAKSLTAADRSAAAESHAAKYGWSANNYRRVAHQDASDVLAEIEALGGPEQAIQRLSQEIAELRVERTRLLGSKSRLMAELPAHMAELVEIHDLVGGTMLDLRKQTVMRVNGRFDAVLSAMASEVGHQREDLDYLLPQEFDAYVSNPDRYVERLSDRRKSFLVYMASFSVLDDDASEVEGLEPAVPDGPRIAEGPEQVEAMFERLSNRLGILRSGERSLDRITGRTIVSAPDGKSVRGIVRVVRDPKTDPFIDGEILVAPSTTPDYMSAIRRCRAIVSDWGGEASHAALTARELRKPCIVGTGYASYVLHDGDEVEIDFDEQVVRMISRHKS